VVEWCAQAIGQAAPTINACPETPYMTIRPATLDDLPVCLALDHSYLTEYVWQMDVQEQNGQVGVTFRTTRLPRPVHVQYPRDQEALLADWHHRDCFLIADTQEIAGYLTMSARDWHKTGWVADLVVAPEYRRRGLATQLLQAGLTWARQEGLRRLIVEAQTKNYPAIRFLERQGFSFCGYNDRYYVNQDIAIFFVLNLC
jgi:ribosomal protein S18 acetylase RimI-like enzyme